MYINLLYLQYIKGSFYFVYLFNKKFKIINKIKYNN